MSVRRDATFCLEAILASQPFRERPGANSYLCAPEHRAKEPDLGRKVPVWMSPRLALYDYLALDGPEQSPLRRKILHLDQIGWTQIVAALAHSGQRGFFRTSFVASLKKSERLNLHSMRTEPALGSPADHVRVLIRCCGELVQHHGALSAKPADTHRN